MGGRGVGVMRGARSGRLSERLVYRGAKRVFVLGKERCWGLDFEAMRWGSRVGEYMVFGRSPHARRRSCLFATFARGFRQSEAFFARHFLA